MIFHSTTFKNFPGISDLLSEVSKFQHHTKLCSKCSTLLVSSINVSLAYLLFIFCSEAASLSSPVVHDIMSVVAGHHCLCRLSQLSMTVMAHVRLCEEAERVFHHFFKCHLKMLLGGLHDSNRSIRVGTAKCL
jgi:hypothetical protein